VCRLFNTPEGCRYGSKCKFSHRLQKKKQELKECEEKVESPQPVSQNKFDLLSDENTAPKTDSKANSKANREGCPNLRKPKANPNTQWLKQMVPRVPVPVPVPVPDPVPKRDLVLNPVVSRKQSEIDHLLEQLYEANLYLDNYSGLDRRVRVKEVENDVSRLTSDLERLYNETDYSTEYDDSFIDDDNWE
jgi:hypothetical protein